MRNAGRHHDADCRNEPQLRDEALVAMAFVG
jgi:hypothetical protein